MLFSTHPRINSETYFDWIDNFTYCFVRHKIVFRRVCKWFLTNSSVHSINTRNKHHLHRPIANLTCFQKGASYSGIRIFNNIPQSITGLRNEKLQFTVALKNFYVHTPFTLWMNFLHVHTVCITDLHDFVNLYTVIILCLVCFCM